MDSLWNNLGKVKTSYLVESVTAIYFIRMFSNRSRFYSDTGL